MSFYAVRRGAEASQGAVHVDLAPEPVSGMAVTKPETVRFAVAALRELLAEGGNNTDPGSGAGLYLVYLEPETGVFMISRDRGVGMGPPTTIVPEHELKANHPEGYESEPISLRVGLADWNRD